MINSYLSFDELRRMYPNEWIVLGNPKLKGILALGGVVLYHSKDKKEVCYIGKDKIADFETVTVVFAGDTKKYRKTGMLKRYKNFDLNPSTKTGKV